MENEDKFKCTNCKCYRIEADFIGKSGNVVKRCLKCRQKDAKQKKRPDIIEKRNKRQNEKKYYIKHREKKRAENEEEYLKNNAENMRKWCENNKEHKNNIVIPKIDKCEEKITKREKHEIIKEKIVVTKQQPNKEKEHKEPVDTYIPKKRVYTRGSNLPDNCKIKSENIPKYCYYVKATKLKGDAFCCTKLHPKQKESGKDWMTTRSKKISIEDKYKQLMEYLNI
jgi:hypothetical protein